MVLYMHKYSRMYIISTCGKLHAAFRPEAPILDMTRLYLVEIFKQ